MRIIEIIAAVALSVLQCAAFLFYGPQLVQRMAKRLHDIITAAADKIGGHKA